MKRGNLLALLRRGRASWSVVTLYLLLLPLLLGVLPKPGATAEFLLLRDLATAEICTMSGSGKVPGQPIQHQPDCILCATACPFAGPMAGTTPADASTNPSLPQQTVSMAQPKDFALPASRLFTSDIQPRGPPDHDHFRSVSI